jgi:hypothetical protein
MKITMKQLIVFASFLALTSLACSQVQDSQDQSEVQAFGEGVESEEYISLDELWPMMEGQDTVETALKASVAEVCQKKGCWMNLVQTAESEETIMVQFKDYGFFMPKDIAGREVIVEGIAYRQITPVDELKHYAEDAGKSQEEIDAITEPQEETRFLASGVVLLPKT